MTRISLMAALLAMSTACAVPKIMLYEGFVPGTDKVSRESLKPVATVGSKGNQTTLSNYYITVCDSDGNEAKNCQTTLILENINNYQVYRPGVYR